MRLLRRLLSFLAARLVIFALGAAALVCAFYMAVNGANIYVLLSDGMAKRVEVILTREDVRPLRAYFTDEFLAADRALAVAFSESSPYLDYNISDFDHELSLEWLWVWPWDQTAECVVTERVPKIEGSVVKSRKNQVSEEVPAWQGGKYTVTLLRQNGRWRIAGMRQTQILPEPTS